ncbi:transcription factor DUO1-like [Euphorbia lathyris]|uniref:transcription factor DUO1-like n=1 Tax=Euphorbia lathyris TaxID=212925 RepID=UPI0033137031
MEAKKDDMVRKGPWKAEEDEVLINHVKKHGARDWSSIRSKGLLKRTGKSCRLRWVNKLRPNLKNGCKFTAEEERVVIELQSQIGNKWAKIATYLPGRTDNDVKNFWSSRQKRLARILQASSTTGSSSSSSNLKPQKAKKEVSVVCDFQAPPLQSYSMEEDSSARAHLCSSSYVENATTTQPLAMIQLQLTTDEMSDFDTNHIQVEPELQVQQQIPFHEIPQPHPELTFSPESREVLARLEDPYPFINVFGPPETGSLGPPFFDPAFQNPETPDIFFDDIPADMFDNIEQLPSP